MALVEIKNLSLEFVQDGSAARVLDDLSLAIEPGETLCLVGESGSGKTVTALSLARLLPSPPARYVSGEIQIEGKDVLRMSKRELHGVRGRTISYVFQEPSASLNPVYRVGTQIKEALRLRGRDAATDQAVIELMESVGIAEPALRCKSFPHQLSGGMQQRVMIAMAIAAHPKLLVADEPTTALDVTVQAQVLELLAQLKQRLGMSILLITHNLAIVRGVADRAGVMYAGQLVELGPAEKLIARPLHPYTKALIQSVPQLGDSSPRLQAIPGVVPQPSSFPSGCRFHPRCPVARPDCVSQPPALVQAEEGRWVRCPYWDRS